MNIRNMKPRNFNHEKHEKGEKIIYKKESYELQGAIFEVYRKMGSGFLEAVYQECLEKEFDLRKIPFQSQTEIRLSYKDTPLSQTYRADFICFDSILVSHVIEHTGFDEGLNLLKEHLPYLKDGGKVVLITPQAKGYRTDPTHVEFIDFKKQKKMIHMADLRMQKQYSFPFPVLVGNFFPYNEFISVGIKTDQGFDSDAE